MLEARKLSDKLQSHAHGGVWFLLSMLSLCLATVLMLSVWLGTVFEPPRTDPSQEKMVQDHAKAVEAIGKLAVYLSDDQELTAELFEQFSALRVPLEKFAQTSAKGLHADAQSRDPGSWPGRANLMLDDLKILLNAKEPLLNVLSLRESLIKLYKPKGPVNPLRFPELSATRGFYLTSLEWAQAVMPDVSAPKMTWALLAKGKTSWRQLNSQVAALDAEVKLEDDTGRGKIAQDLLASLSQNDLLQQIRNSEFLWTQAWLAQGRMLISVDKLPPLPQTEPAPVDWTWGRLAYPGSTAEGVRASVVSVFLALVFTLLGYFARRRRLLGLSDQWLSLTQKFENAVRGVDAPLVTVVARVEALSSEFVPLMAQLRALREWSQASPASRSLEEDVWVSAARMQADLESELMLLREKLLNIHLHFCNGTTRENLVYDLAFTTEAVDTVSESARNLGRSFVLLKESLRQDKAVDNDQEMDAVIRQVDGLKNVAKRVAIHLQELSGRLKVAVEDVPEGRRFDALPQRDEQGRLRVDTQI